MRAAIAETRNFYEAKAAEVEVLRWEPEQRATLRYLQGYPPALLAAKDWQGIIDHLDQHFGSDASLESAEQARIARFLVRHAGDAGHEPEAAILEQDRAQALDVGRRARRREDHDRGAARTKHGAGLHADLKRRTVAGGHRPSWP